MDLPNKYTSLPYIHEHCGSKCGLALSLKLHQRGELFHRESKRFFFEKKEAKNFLGV